MYWIALRWSLDADAPDAPVLPTPEALGWWALRYTPHVAWQDEALMLEVSACERLWGGRSSLMRQLAHENPAPGAVMRGAQGATSLIALARLRLFERNESRPKDIPAGLPSQLLERRPDIAAAERRTAAANAQIGVAQAAYFPSLTLTGSFGYQSRSFADWFKYPSSFWALGPALAQTIFDGGLRKGVKAQTIAIYDENVANYRQTVLLAFQEVEDNLSALRILEREAELQDEAVKSANESVQITLNQYKAGIVDYLNVVNVETIALNNQINALNIQADRLSAAVLLIRAVGGGWDTSQLDRKPE